MKEGVNMCKPLDLLEMISSALQMKSNSSYKMVNRDMQHDSRGVLIIDQFQVLTLNQGGK